MAFIKLTPAVFKDRLAKGEYTDAGSARKSAGKAATFSDKDKKNAETMIAAHDFGSGAKKPAAAKPAAAKKTVAKKTAKKAAAKKVAKKPAAPVATKQPVKKGNGGRAKKTAKKPAAKAAGKKAAKDENGEGQATETSTGKSPPDYAVGTFGGAEGMGIRGGMPVVTAKDVAENPILAKNMAASLAEVGERALTAARNAKIDDPNLDVTGLREQGLGLMTQAAHLAQLTGSAVHAAAVQASAPHAMLDAAAVASAPTEAVDPEKQRLFDKSADVAEKVHGKVQPKA